MSVRASTTLGSSTTSSAAKPKGQASVLLVDGGGKVDVRLVDVGRTVGDSWQVLSGLKPGDRVIVEGGQNVRPGMSVKIRGEG